MSDKPQNKEEGVNPFNPFFGASLLATCFISGFGWIPWAIAACFLANVAGYYTEAKINELDCITRQKAKEATGNEQPGDAKDLGELVRKTNQTLGVLCPPIPLVSLGCAIYMRHKAHSLAKVGGCKTSKDEITLAPGFTAEGRCVF